MTAEIALLNKVAIALAADSAATLSAGNKYEKVFNSEDKLFELSNSQPIGIMIYNSTSFLETPIQVIIRNFRNENKTFNTIDEAAVEFRRYLNNFGRRLSDGVRKRSADRLTSEPIYLISELFDQRVEEIPNHLRTSTDYNLLYEDCVSTHIDIFGKASPCNFLDSKSANAYIRGLERALSKNIDKSVGQDERRKIAKLNSTIIAFLKSDIQSRSSTGFVIAGFGKKELFPSLRSFVVDGMIADTLRFMNEKKEDITFEGPALVYFHLLNKKWLTDLSAALMQVARAISSVSVVSFLLLTMSTFLIVFQYQTTIEIN